MGRYSYTYAETGEMFGLKSTDLTEEQLKKINLPKLFEFLCYDNRVGSVVAGKMVLEPTNNDWYDPLKDQSALIKERYPNISITYNKIIREFPPEDDDYYRKNRLIWELMDEDLRIEEIQRWTSGKTSTVDGTNIDYKWAFKRFPDVAKQAVDAALSTDHSGYGYRYTARRSIYHMIDSLPGDKIEEIVPQIKARDIDTYLRLLNNPETPRKHLVDLLRTAHGRTYMPEMQMKIDAEILSKLPPIMRLDMAEKMMQSSGISAELLDFKDIDEFRTLFMSSVIKYQKRVEMVMQRFRHLKGIKETEETELEQ
jgi:hypothetical protein